ncbi:hypothetical protein QAD02_005919 [Eretmocerus hayati]|uniref:Uncharacterized protein n=1 Tax=Eretmocerus hayati TaxID=131215 RepID=A0ACC2N1N6_9HYME|nr:hypothetical protein QAD02_005919 [Eretmocerus hayati]
MMMESDTESDTDSQEHRIAYEAKRLRHVFDPYFKRIFSSDGFIRHMNQRCCGSNDSTSYILLCEAIKRNDSRSAISLLRHYCKANMGNPDPSKDIPLQLATLAGNIEVVEMLLNKGARVNVCFQDQRQPLHLICDKSSTTIPDETRRIAIAKLLLKHGANINAVEKSNRDTPLILAVRSKYFRLTEFLLNNGSDRHYLNKNSETAFQVAFSENAGIQMIELLYDDKCNLHQVDPNDYTVFSYAVRNLMNSGYGSGFYNLNEPLKCIQFLLKRGISVNSTLDKRGNNILHMICQNHAVQTMKIFLVHGANVNARNVDGKTPLHFCAENQPMNFIDLLINHGADMNIQSKDGQTIIHFAAANRYCTVLENLLRYGTHNVNAICKDGNFTPLFNAVWSNRSENVRTLLDWQANSNQRILNNQIALHVAVDQKHPKIVELLLDHNSDVNASDHYGNTPLTISRNQDNESISSNDSDDGNESSRASESVRIILTKHVAKLFSTGAFVSDQSLRVMNSSRFKDLFEVCTEELNLMKDTEIRDNVTFHDVLVRGRDKLMSYARNDGFLDDFYESRYEDKFSIYCNALRNRVEMTVLRLDLMEKAGENIVKLVQNSDTAMKDFYLPLLVVEKILDYFNIADLEILASLC